MDQNFPHLFFRGSKIHGYELIQKLKDNGASNSDKCVGNNQNMIYYISPKNGKILVSPKDDLLAEIITSCFKEVKPSTPNREISPLCPNCGERLALVRGSFSFLPDDEPFESGKEEEIELSDYTTGLTALTCPKCAHITDFHQE